LDRDHRVGDFGPGGGVVGNHPGMRDELAAEFLDYDDPVRSLSPGGDSLPVRAKDGSVGKR
jgi:hypothetical protein